MISLPMVCWILFAHWYADFIMQTDKMAKNKSKNWDYLSLHISTYSLWLFVFLAPPAFIIETARGTFLYLPAWILLNSGCHFVTDAITSRITSQLFAENEIHNAFCVIGFDQLIHTTFLIGTWIWLMT